MSNIEVIGLGALNIDHIYRVERILDDGEAVVNEARSFPGGSAANTIYGLTKLGAREGFPTLIELTQRYHELYSQQSELFISFGFLLCRFTEDFIHNSILYCLLRAKVEVSVGVMSYLVHCLTGVRN